MPGGRAFEEDLRENELTVCNPEALIMLNLNLSWFSLFQTNSRKEKAGRREKIPIRYAGFTEPTCDLLNNHEDSAI